jgi:hypothetical protein
VALEWTYHLGPVNIAHGPAPVDLFLGTLPAMSANSPICANPPVDDNGSRHRGP